MKKTIEELENRIKELEAKVSKLEAERAQFHYHYHPVPIPMPEPQWTPINPFYGPTCRIGFRGNSY